mmetsp:Transcript_42683/g.56352  ORF Transcript_42683/g.56352 Transcript_42683/m.56352 type:complete len:154 (+) Transcript_42683:75-536(+)
MRRTPCLTSALCRQPLPLTAMTSKPSVLLVQVPGRSFVKSMEDRKEEKDAQAFREDIQYFLAKDEFNLYDFHERVLHGLKSKSSIKVMIWGEDAEIKVLEEQNKICSAMYDHEKVQDTEWNKDLKKEVAEAASVQVSDIEDLLEKYRQLKDFH